MASFFLTSTLQMLLPNRLPLTNVGTASVQIPLLEIHRTPNPVRSQLFCFVFPSRSQISLAPQTLWETKDTATISRSIVCRTTSGKCGHRAFLTSSCAYPLVTLTGYSCYHGLRNPCVACDTKIRLPLYLFNHLSGVWF